MPALSFWNVPFLRVNTDEAIAPLRATLHHEVHVWRWSGPRADPRLGALLARYLGLAPAELRWKVGPHGKPAVAPGGLSINWSHCDGEMLLAVTQGVEVGVDIEMPRTLRRRQALLDRAFTTSERLMLANAPDEVVLRAWSLKEALVKAIGRGIAYGLARIELDLADAASPRLIALHGPAGPAAAWQLAVLPQPDSALAAVAWGGGPRAVRQFRLDAATDPGPHPSSMETPGD